MLVSELSKALSNCYPAALGFIPR